MKLRSTFTLTLYLVVFSSLDEVLAKRRNEAFNRALKQMKLGFKDALTKLGSRKVAPAVGEHQHRANGSELMRVNDGANGEAITGTNQTLADQRYEIIRRLQSTLTEKLSKVPPGKLKIGLLEKFKKELAKTVTTQPKMANDSNDDPMVRLQSSIVEKLAKEIREQEEQERMQDPKQRHRMLEQREKENLQNEMNKLQTKLSLDLERRSKLEFQENLPNRIRARAVNTTSLKEELTTLMVDLVESKDMLEEMKRTCRECKRIYEVDVSATLELANYLLQNVDLEIDLMTAVVKVMNRQPNLMAGTFEFDFTRAAFDSKLLRKASTEIYEMTRSFAEMRELQYKIKDKEWSHLANKTGVLFFRMNNELSKQNRRFCI